MKKKKTQSKIDSLIIDSNNLLHRVYWISENKSSVSLPYLFLNSIKKYVRMFPSKDIYMVWDKRLVPNFKNFRQTNEKIQYKATRDKERNKKVYKHQVPLQKIVKLLGIKNIYPGVMEGDDVAAWLCKNLPGKKVVVSVDQDFLQLINQDVSVYSPIKDIIITESNFFNITGVKQKQFLNYKAILGDKSDNIPGIPRVGEKTAKKIIARGMDTLNEQHQDIISTNIRVMSLDVGYSTYKNESVLYAEQVKRLSKLKPDFKSFESLCSSMNMNEVLRNLHEWKNLFTGNEKIVATVQKLINAL